MRIELNLAAGGHESARWEDSPQRWTERLSRDLNLASAQVARRDLYCPRSCPAVWSFGRTRILSATTSY
jgi:hypothetical protein